jgi:DNA-binding response OmpR family regulator
MGTTKVFQKPRILVVEDDRDVSAVICLALEDFFDLTVAESPGTAIQALKAEPFELVLLDWRLGRACGSEVLAEINSTEAASRPQVIITSGGNDASLQEALVSGEYHLLPKPYLLEDLTKAVTRLLTRNLKKKGSGYF